MTPRLRVAIVVTLKNEEDTIYELLSSILKQTRVPDEVIIVDGGSTDTTVDVIKQFTSTNSLIKLIIKAGNRSVGRNAGIKATACEIIASTDCGIIMDEVWLEEITRPFEDGGVDVVGGVTLPLAGTIFEICVGAINLPEVFEIDHESFLPSSRCAAFTKETWQKVGGYPEAFNWNEDTIFDLLLKKSGARIVFNPKASVRWRPPGDYRTVWRQFYNYARGDGQAGVYFKDFYWPKKFQLYIVGLILALAGLLTPVFFYALIVLMLAYMTRPGKKVLARTSRPAALLTLGTIIATRDIAEIAGYIKGVLERRQDPELFTWKI